jgi:single-strand DNA-binding protein
MGFVNKVMLLGNVSQGPELRQLPSGTAVCEFSLATNRVYKTAAGEERQEMVFVDCTGFGRTAEVIHEYCPKGRALFVEGRLHYETWEDKSGGKRSKLGVIVESFQFIGSRENTQMKISDSPEHGRESGVISSNKEKKRPSKPARRGYERFSEGVRPETPAKLGRSETDLVEQKALEVASLEDAELPF